MFSPNYKPWTFEEFLNSSSTAIKNKYLTRSVIDGVLVEGYNTDVKKWIANVDNYFSPILLSEKLL